MSSKSETLKISIESKNYSLYFECVRDVEGSSIYSSSKTALNAVMKIAALELAPRKIRVNSVSPGPTETEVMKKVGLVEITVKSIMDVVVDKIPLKQMGTSEDVAKMVSYLSSEASKFITGADFIMDGGMVLV